MAKKKQNKHDKILIGLVDADLLDNGTRHPNLVLLKLAGFFFDNNLKFELILDSHADINKYDIIYMSCVFTFTKKPDFYTRTIGTKDESKFQLGGTGFYANIKDIKEFRILRYNDMNQLKNDSFLNKFPNKYGSMGIKLNKQMPYYDLYKPYVDAQVKKGFKREKFKDYEKYSIGFLTRGCIRHCPFCVNKLERKIKPYSKLEWFLDNKKDKHNRFVRPYIYLWDDNFLAADYEIWKPLLEQLIKTNRPFQFRQGLDERMIAQSPHGEEMAQMLSNAKYHGDFIFAFDNWRDKDLIQRALKIWKRYNPQKGTKFYLFCGYKLTANSHEKFYKDIYELFQRIKILMSYGCVGYVMRHQDYHKYELANLYVQIARWCNQQQFYKKMSFWQFVYRNQSYWEEKTLNIKNRPALKTFEEFKADFDAGYYGDGDNQVKLCLPLRTVLRTLDKFKDREETLLEMFNYKIEDLKDPSLWEEKEVNYANNQS